MSDESVIVVGGGIAGLTAAALLAKEGVSVTLLEAHYQAGGCAGTFKRGKYIFDVGATQVAGFEVNGIHSRLFRHLGIPRPTAELLDPGCLVDLADGSSPISLWHDPKRWKEEIQLQFPGTGKFWQLCSRLHKINWAFSNRFPVISPRNLSDLLQLFKALRLPNFASSLFIPFSIADVLKICGCHHDLRLKSFLDLQLKLYSQEPAERTSALYGATVLQMAQEPLGLWHLYGSMQTLSNVLLSVVRKYGGKVLLGHRVIKLTTNESIKLWEVNALNSNKMLLKFSAKDVIFTLPPQLLPTLMPSGLSVARPYFERIKHLKQPTGAFVFYGALNRSCLPTNCPLHFQLFLEDPGPLFVSISKEGDGRAPKGDATVIASVFTPTGDWCYLSEEDYLKRKKSAWFSIRSALENWLNCSVDNWIHQEFATPRSFAKWTGRPQGIVGGLGQTPLGFGPFGLASRSPIRGLWLCGDSVYPGEGTAGVSNSALIACRQLLGQRGCPLDLAD